MKKVIDSLKQKTYVMAGMLLTSSVIAAPSATGINNESQKVVDLIIDILAGPTGYLLTLIAFVGGIFFYIQKRDFWASMGCFALALAIIIVPSALSGFFTTTP